MSISQKRLELQLSGLERLLLSTISPDCHLYLCKRLKRKIQTCEHFQEYSTNLTAKKVLGPGVLYIVQYKCVWFNYIVSSIILVLSIVVILVVLYYFSVCCERGAKCDHALSFTVGSCEGVVCSLRVFLCAGHYQRSFFSKDSKFSFSGCSFNCVMLSRSGKPPPS